MNTIHLTPDPGEPQKFAAEELNRFLSLIETEADLSVAMCLEPNWEEGEYRITGQGDYRISAGSDAGLLYGSYELLRQFGFRFFSPDSWDTVIPAGKIVLPEVNVHVCPPFELRGFFAVEKRDTPEFLLWMARHGLNLWSSEVHHPELCRKLGMKLRGNPPSGMHRLFADFLPAAQYGNAHPEWYALHEGKRMNGPQILGGAWNICMSNPEGVQQLCENIISALNPGGSLENVSAFSFAPFDNGKWCECESCRAMGNRTARLLKVADICSKKIREKVARPVQLIVPAYHETLPPPDGELPDFDSERIAIEFFVIERCYAHKMEDPSCPGNNMLRQFYEAWGKQGKFKLSIGEYYNVSTFASAAFVFDDTIPHDVKFYARNGGRFIDYMHVSTALWGELALTNCAFADAVNGKTFDFEDFLVKRYGKAADTMRQVYESLRRFSHLAKPFFHYLGTGEMTADGAGTVKFSVAASLNDYRENRPFYLPGHFEEDRSTNDVPSLQEALQLLHKAQKLLDSANAGEDERVRHCLETDKMRLEATVRRAELVSALIHLLTAEKAGDTEHAKQFALQIRECGEAMRQDTLSVSHIREKGAPNLALYVNALTATQLQQLYAEKMKEYNLAIRPFLPEEGVTVKQG